MDFKQSTISDILNSEKEMVLKGAARYGEYFIKTVASKKKSRLPRLK